MPWPRLLLPFLCAFILTSFHSHPARFHSPRVVLWAWDRAEDLRFLDPHSAGVAFLAATATIDHEGDVHFRPRGHALLLPPGIDSVAVVRIESVAKHGPVRMEPLLEGLRYTAAIPGVTGLQIDFDARASERPFYVELLAQLTGTATRPVGITALASWCSGDAWIDGTQVAEAVPMFFRMGYGENESMAVRSRACQTSIGLSMDEPFPAHRPVGLFPNSRVYLFNPLPWTRGDYENAAAKLTQWK